MAGVTPNRIDATRIQRVDSRQDNAYRSEGGSWLDGHMATGARRSDYPPQSTWSKVPPYYLGLSAKLCESE